MTVLAGRYTLLERVGEGAVGVVWRARDDQLERDVAVKLLRPFAAGEPEQRRRFEREARTLAVLASDLIVRVYDYVDDGEQAFLVMEFVDGCNLAQATSRRLPLPVADAAAYTAPVARALVYAHAKGVVHRDLSPANILIERESGRVVTTDFGLARIARSSGWTTVPGSLMGTPEFWSPEQASGRESGPAADMYALGCILHLLLGGRLPFESEDRFQAGLRRAHEDAPSLRERAPDVPPNVVALVDDLLVRDPALRPDAGAVSAMLDELAEGARPVAAGELVVVAGAPASTAVLPQDEQTIVLAPPTAILPARQHLRKPSKRRRIAAALVASTGAALGAFLLAEKLDQPVQRAPNLVALRETAAREQIERLLPGTSVVVARAYSTRVPKGRVIRQRPLPRATIPHGALLRLTVSRGTPYAPVPAIAAGAAAAAARRALARHGFGARYRYTPSWTVRKGAVIELRPAAGTRLRRPATVKVVVASGYPRERVPDVENAAVASAQGLLSDKHLRYQVVYRLSENVSPGLVLAQLPAAGAIVYRNTRVRLTVARTLRWVRVLASSGTDSYQSERFSVPARWRIRYKVAAGSGLFPALAQVTWSRDGDPFARDGFLARGTDSLRTYDISDGAGDYRLSIVTDLGINWYVEVDALK
jgi:serine/threonine-protein kinase